jgi:hypothetical protein
MNHISSLEETKELLLRELNKRRAKEGKDLLATYPQIECTFCGEPPDRGEKLVESAVPYIRTCQRCVLKLYPYSKLRLPSLETIEWYRSNPTFHRSSNYGIVLTNHALYLFSSFWLMFARWHRYSLGEIYSAKFHDSRLFPALRVQLNDRAAVLRTPPDYADEMERDRRNLVEAAERIRAVAKGVA